MNSFHPRQKDFQTALAKVLPESMASFLFGVGAVSSLYWPQGGVTVRGISTDQAITYRLSQSSPRDELLEFFACVCGNRSLEHNGDAEFVLDAFERAIKQAYPDSVVYLEVVPVERSWCYELLVFISDELDGKMLYFELFWSVD